MRGAQTSPELLTGRRVMVTGGSRGLGLAIARAIGRAGAEPILVARNEEQLAAALAELRDTGVDATIIAADLSDTASTRRLVDEVGGQVDGVVHAAGVQHRAAATEFGDDDFSRVLAVNLTAPFRLSRDLVKHAGDRIPVSHVFVGSLGSSIAIPRAVGYAASKAGVLGVARTLALEWAPYGIRVNVLSPGYFYTELTADLLDDPVQHARVTSRIPMGRLGDPEELGGAAVFLLSSWASYMTGQQLVVDGGWLGA